MLEVGIKGSKSFVVDEDSLASSVGSGNLPVYATPSMIALIETTASESVMPYLDMGMSTVGTHLDIAHSSATPLGLRVVCETELIEIDRRRLVFKVRVYDQCGEVGSGIHERFVVDAAKFMEKAALKTSGSSSRL